MGARIELRKTRAELAAAEEAVRRMQTAETFKDFREAWEDFLNKIAKVWIKTERECQPTLANFKPWQGSYKRVLRNDPLLAYVCHARNVDQHSIQPIAGVTFEIEATIPPGGTAVIEIDHGLAHLRLSGDVNESSLSAPRYVLLPITDSGVPYPVPATHLGRPIPQSDPLSVAQLALSFFTQFVTEAAARFEQHIS